MLLYLPRCLEPSFALGEVRSLRGGILFVVRCCDGPLKDTWTGVPVPLQLAVLTTMAIPDSPSPYLYEHRTFNSLRLPRLEATWRVTGWVDLASVPFRKCYVGGSLTLPAALRNTVTQKAMPRLLPGRDMHR